MPQVGRSLLTEIHGLAMTGKFVDLLAYERSLAISTRPIAACVGGKTTSVWGAKREDAMWLEAPQLKKHRAKYSRGRCVGMRHQRLGVVTLRISTCSTSRLNSDRSSGITVSDRACYAMISRR